MPRHLLDLLHIVVVMFIADKASAESSVYFPRYLHVRCPKLSRKIDVNCTNCIYNVFKNIISIGNGLDSLDYVSRHCPSHMRCTL